MPGRRSSPWTRWRTVLLVVLLLLPGTPEVLSRLYADQATRERALAALAPGRNVLPDQRVRHQAAPPSPSGAYPPYPLNHTFDAETVDLPGAPANHDFEIPATDIGTPPTNHDLETSPTGVGTPPTNYDFASGDFTGWTTGGAPTIQTDATQGSYAQLSTTNAAVTTAAFTVDASAQAFTLRVNFVGSNGGILNLSVLTGPTYTNSTSLGSLSCSGTECGGWHLWGIDAAAYLGQSVKVKAIRAGGGIAVDEVQAGIAFAGFALTGRSRLLQDDGTAYANIVSGSLTTAPLTVDAAAQFGSVRLAGQTTSGDQYVVRVLSGAGYATSTEVASGVAADTWTPVLFNLGPWVGQSVKVRVERTATGSIGVDDLGVQRIEVPGWTATDEAVGVDDGQGGTGVRFDGHLISSAFTLPTDVQQLYFRYRPSDQSGTGVYAELLRGPTFTTVTNLAGGVLGGTSGVWTSYAALVTTYAGETVKLRFRSQLQPVYVDDAGIPQQAVPGWTLTTQAGFGAAVPGSDADGTFVTGANGALLMTSSPVDPGIVDAGGSVQGRSYVVRAAIGQSNPSQLVVTWVPEGAGSGGVVLSAAASSPTGLVNYRFSLFDTLAPRGRFEVKLTGGGRIYSIADNVARQQLSEPFSQQAGAGIDTSTGSFGTSETDLSILGGPLPLSFTRYYHGHSDRYAELGYRWSHTFATYLGLYGDDVAVVFGSGKEEYFAADGGALVPIDPRVKSTLTLLDPPVDGVDYRYVTKDGLTYNFEGDGDLISIVDPNGHAITLYRDPTTERITSI
jgi:hypothetical protein